MKIILAALLLGLFNYIGVQDKDKDKNWQQYDSPEFKFSVQFPGKIEEVPQPPDQEHGILQSKFISATGNGKAFVIICLELSPDELARTSEDAVLNDARDQMIADMSGKLISEAPLKLADFNGKEISFELQKEQLVQARLLLVKNYAYFISVRMKKNDKNTDAVKRFFESFRISN